MPYKQFYNHLFEGRNADLAKTILDKADRADAYDALDNLDQTPTKKHLPTLAKFYVETSNLNVLQDYYKRFSASKLKGKDISQFKDFHEFELAVDAASSSLEDAESIEVNGHPVYSDSKVDIFKGDSQKACIQYGKGYGFCISNKQLSSNLFYSYRLKEGAKLTAYFVRFKDKSSEIKNNKFIDPLHLIVLHVGNGTMLMTGADNGSQGHGTKPMTQESLLQEFPELKPAVDKNVLVSDKYNELEQDVIQHIHGKRITDEDFIKFSTKIKTAYISTGHQISDKMWDASNRDQRLLYVNVGSGYDLTEHQKETVKDDAKFMQNYWRVIKTRIDAKKEEFTTDERQYISDNKYFPANINGSGIYELLRTTSNPQEMAGILGKKNINNLLDHPSTLLSLLNNTPNKSEMMDVILKHRGDSLTPEEVDNLLFNTSNKLGLVTKLGKENINKISNAGVYNVLKYTQNKQKLAVLLGQKNINKLNNGDVHYLLQNTSNTREMAAILGQTNINKLTGDDVYILLKITSDKQEMAAILGRDSINKLFDNNIDSLLKYAPNKQEMIDILLKYKGNILTPNNITTLVQYTPNKQEVRNKLTQLGYKLPVAENKITYKQFYTTLL